MNTQITTLNKKVIDITNPKVQDFLIADIAQALSRMGRFNYQIEETWTVAQHSLMCLMYYQYYSEVVAQDLSELPDPRVGLALLLHDASEAYLGDVVSPLKGLLPQYKAIEDSFSSLIYKKYIPGYDVSAIKDYIHEVDLKVRSFEISMFRGEKSELSPMAFIILEGLYSGLSKLSYEDTQLQFLISFTILSEENQN